MLQGAQFKLYAAENGSGVLLVVLCSSIIALLYNVVHALLIKQTSAVTVTVLGEVKVVGLLILSAIVLGKRSLYAFLQLHQPKALIPKRTEFAVEICFMMAICNPSQCDFVPATILALCSD